MIIVLSEMACPAASEDRMCSVVLDVEHFCRSQRSRRRGEHDQAARKET
jgi:hypothetical protein